jgi:alkylation response protein AidB-like acyl-CoA dehydrogenase
VVDFQFSQEEIEFRDSVRNFIDINVPKDLLWAEHDAFSDVHWPKVNEVRKKLGNSGLSTVHWPTEYGGQGASQIAQLMLREEMAYNGVPDAIAFDDGSNLIGPSIIKHGSEYLKSTHLPNIASGESFWCQGYTEPGGGSDLAALRTTAILDGNNYVLNGQKDYISGAARAGWIHTLARTNRDEPGNKGLSYFAIDMNSPGITLRALDEVHGRSGVLNEVFFDDLKVPIENMVGQPEQGWNIAMETLNRERGGIEVVGRARGLLKDLVTYLRDSHIEINSSIKLNDIKIKLGQMVSEIESCRLTAYKVAWLQQNGKDNGHESSVGRLLSSEMWREFSLLALRILGLYGNLYNGVGAPLQGRLNQAYVGSIAESIYMGTPEIHRNIIARIGLGLTNE